MSASVLRKVPPWSTVREVFQLLGLSTETPYEFQRDQINLQNSLTAASMIEPYQMPCKAENFFKNLDAQRWTVLLRHIVAPHGHQLKSFETTRNRKKVVLQTLTRLGDSKGDIKVPISIDFS